MNCPRCGNALSDAQSRFCGRCGAGVPSAGAKSPLAPALAAAGAPAASATATYEYAPFVLRAIAWVVDLIAMLTLALGPVIALVWALSAWAASSGADAEGAGWAGLIFLVLGILFFSLPVMVLYQLIAAASGGGAGKRVPGLRVVRISDGQAPGWGTGAVRVIVPAAIGFGAAPFAGFVPEAVGGLVAWAIPAANYGWALFDPDHQALHDKAAGTVVISVRG